MITPIFVKYRKTLAPSLNAKDTETRLLHASYNKNTPKSCTRSHLSRFPEEFKQAEEKE